MYSASVVLKATEVRFLLLQETMEDTKVKQHLKVLFLFTVLQETMEDTKVRQHFHAISLD
jgi:hypothetical protein